MQETLFDNTKDINTVLTGSGEVSPIFHGHFFQMETNLYGIQGLITEILRARGAEYKAKDLAASDLKNVIVATSMLTIEILAEVERRFTQGSIRYPEKTVRATLSVTMTKLGKIGHIQLSKADYNARIETLKKLGRLPKQYRDSSKSCFVWYLIAK